MEYKKEPHWTKEQESAITCTGCNILVSAAAGSGKTAVLVERLIRRILDPQIPVDVDQLLVVTFTNAAAAEMRERIRLALEKELSLHPSSQRLSLQLALLNRARITTLHSFCLEVLKQHFYLLDLDPGFRIADETEAALLRMDVLEEMLESMYLEEHEDFSHLADVYGGERGDGPLLDLIQRLYDFARSNPRPEEWLQEKASWFSWPQDCQAEALPWLKEIKKSIALVIAGARTALSQALVLCQEPGGPEAWIGLLTEELMMLEQLESGCQKDWQHLQQAFAAISFRRIPKVNPMVEESHKEQVQNLRDKVKQSINQLKKRYFSRDLEDHLADMRKMSLLMETLVHLVLVFSQAYQREKQARGLVDFHDLEHYCLHLLTTKGIEAGEVPQPSTVALALREQFVEVLVDEYQDINPLQEAILLLVSRQGEAQSNLFMVGDVKQSIYRFRLADPGLFLAKYQAYPGLSHRKTGSQDGLRIDLNKNFRSKKGILEAVNFLCQRIMSPGVGELAYTENAFLQYGATYPEEELARETVDVHLLNRKKEKARTEVETTEEEPDMIRAEALLVAQEIQKMFQNHKAAANKGPFSYRDVVVLLRSTKDWAPIFLEALGQAGIPAYAEAVDGYYDAVEVETILSVLKVIDNPRQDIPLAGVLRSPLVGFGAEELADIKIHAQGNDFYEKLVSYAQEGPNENIRNTLLDCGKVLANWRYLARRGTLADLIWKIYQETGYYDKVGAMPHGSQRQANLRLLHDRARQYESTTLRGLFGFLRFVDRLRQSGGRAGIARTLGENEDVVRIMSIHRSKGLEFPVVFLAGLGKKFNTADLVKPLLLHRDLGFGPDFVDVNLRIKYPTLAKSALKNRLAAESLAEEMRILYVAMTRAKEKLVLIGSSRDLEQDALTWCQGNGKELLLADSHLLAAKSLLDWLGLALVGHPDGTPLRQLVNNPGILPKVHEQGLSHWAIHLHQGVKREASNHDTQISQEWLAMLRAGQRLGEEADELIKKEVDRRLSWQPYKGLEQVAAKVTVSEIKKRIWDIEDQDLPGFPLPGLAAKPLAETLIPSFLGAQAPSLTAAEIGTTIHLIMQHVDLHRPLDAEDLQAQIQEMVAKELFTPEQATAIKIPLLLRFFHSALGKRLRQGHAVYREIPFSLSLPAMEVYQELPQALGQGETILLQGVIDCFVQEPDGLLLLDYKTGRKGQENQSYGLQVKLYARALETITQERVKEMYIYYFGSGEILQVNR